ncbi:P-loop containing nucleoside triphosphate hydrolase protein [Syncephalis fuscata]|nr:P-loop containing nucleoside triphosphate hydrolase protein [Syncephalis fuscata]
MNSYKKIRQQLNRLLSLALIHPEVSVRFGVKPPSGALLYGPPGCGKTWLAKEIIGQLGMHVIVARGTQLFSKYFGETEEKLRQLFRAARQHAPCIVFLDEVDALGTQRDLTDGEAGGKVQERLLSTLLNEMDGISGNTGLFVLACTNRPDRVDDALLRPGRLDHLLYVNLPNKGDRAAILQWHATSFTCPQVDWDLIAEETESFTCGGLAQLVR